MSDLGQLVDHAADLQRSIDRLWKELALVWLALLALATVVAMQGWQAWRA
jgi:hypothetical protein